jgi:hypothetical protein
MLVTIAMANLWFWEKKFAKKKNFFFLYIWSIYHFISVLFITILFVLISIHLLFCNFLKQICNSFFFKHFFKKISSLYSCPIYHHFFVIIFIHSFFLKLFWFLFLMFFLSTWPSYHHFFCSYLYSFIVEITL